VALTPDGQGLVVAGRYAWPPDGTGSGTITFGAGTPEALTLTSAGLSDDYLAGYGLDGRFLGWARSAGGPGSDVGAGVGVLPDGGIVALHDFQGNPATLGPGEPGQVQLPAATRTVAVMGADGLLRWATDAGSGAAAVSCYVTPVPARAGALLACPAWHAGQLVLATFIR